MALLFFRYQHAEYLLPVSAGIIYLMSRRTLVLIIIAVAIVLFSLLYFFKFKHQPDINTILKPQDIYRVIVKDAKLDIPFIDKTETIDRLGLPSFLSFLVLNSAKDVKVQRVYYEGNSTGYQLEYTNNDMLQDVDRLFYVTLVKHPEFKVLAGSRAEKAGFIEMANAQEGIRISELATNNLTLIHINTIEYK